MNKAGPVVPPSGRQFASAPPRFLVPALIASGLVVAGLSGLAALALPGLEERQNRGEERVIASLHAESAVIEQKWAGGDLPASVDTVEQKDIADALKDAQEAVQSHG